MVKTIRSAAWRVGVSPDGGSFSIEVRADTGLEYQTLLGMPDASAILSELLGQMAAIPAGAPGYRFSAGIGPDHPKALPVTPHGVAVERDAGETRLVMDFGGATLKVAVDPAALRAALDAA